MYAKKWKEVECPEFIEGQYAVYILHCKDDSYYVGSTDNLLIRLNYHNKGKGSYWTKTRVPVKLVYYEVYDNRSLANRREKQIKSWTRIKKEKLIAGVWSKIV
jgi:putative endonuclease